MSDVRRKVNFGHLISNFELLCPGLFDCVPRSWALPQQYAALRNHVAQNPTNHERAFIVKPDCGHMANGIYLIQKPEEYVFNNEQHIVQEYVCEPLLIEGHKFDFRLYAIVTSLEPPEFYFFDDGHVRFCSLPYERPDVHNLSQGFMHVSNRNFNKTNPDSGKHSVYSGSKISVRTLYQKLQQMGYDLARIRSDIESLILTTLLAMAPEMRVEYRAQLPAGKDGTDCFQVCNCTRCHTFYIN